MRTLTILASGLFTVLTNTLTHAQPYQPIPDDAHWVVQCFQFNPEPWPGTTAVTWLNYRVGQDTILNGMDYKNINISVDGTAYGSFAIRQVIEDRRVYVLLYDTNEEYLLYDFSLQPGEYYQYAPELYGIQNCLDGFNGSMRLDSISILTPIAAPNSCNANYNYNLRTFYFSPVDQVTSCHYVAWVEGMGCTMGFTSPIGGYNEFGSSWVSTFCTGDTTWAPFNIETCDFVVGVPYQGNESSEVLYWNGSGLVLSSVHSESIKSTSMINVLGSAVSTEVNREPDGSVVAVPLKTVPSGLWVVVVEHYDGSNKFFKVYLNN